MRGSTARALLTREARRGVNLVCPFEEVVRVPSRNITFVVPIIITGEGANLDEQVAHATASAEEVFAHLERALADLVKCGEASGVEAYDILPLGGGQLPWGEAEKALTQLARRTGRLCLLCDRPLEPDQGEAYNAPDEEDDYRLCFDCAAASGTR